METDLAQRFEEDRQGLAAMQIAIRAAVYKDNGSSAGRSAIQTLAARDPELFFRAALSLLESMPDSPERAHTCTRVCECPEFLLQLTRPDRFSRAQLVDLCRHLIQFDKRLDVRLADLLPHRTDDKYRLPPSLVARILDVLNEISVGPRLVLLLNHLTDHPNPEITEKAVVLMGRRIHNAAWPQRHLRSSDPCVRAGAVEALWGRKTPAARAAMWGCVKDDNHRVAGNAVFGLHLLGESGVDELVTGMLDDTRPPFRSTAAQIMGQIGDPGFTEQLTRAISDPDASVRLEAKRALVTIRQPILRQQQLEAEARRSEAAPAPPPPEQPIAGVPAVETPAPAPDETSEEPLWVPDFNLRLDGKHTSTR